MRVLTKYFRRFIKEEKIATFMEGVGQIFDRESVEDMLEAAVLTKWNPIQSPPDNYELCMFLKKDGTSKICCLYEIEDAILWLPYE